MKVLKRNKKKKQTWKAEDQPSYGENGLNPLDSSITFDAGQSMSSIASSITSPPSFAHRTMTRTHSESSNHTSGSDTSRRQRRVFGLFGSIEENPEGEAEEASSKPRRRRRRSLFGSMKDDNDPSTVPDDAGYSLKDPSVVSSEEDNLEVSEGKGTSKPTRRRRSMVGSSSVANESSASERKPRRRSMFGSMPSEDPKSAENVENTRKTSRRHSMTSSSDHTSKSQHLDKHSIVNQERIRRGIEPFSRNMLLDSLAKQTATQLAKSKGKKCDPVDYHGNIGQGASVELIHATMMEDLAGTSRKNILSSRFTEFGVAAEKGKNGMVYVCQLFKK